MKKLLSNYKSTIILLVSIIIGAIVGFIFKEKATVLSPLGDIFLNLLLVVITPLIFSISKANWLNHIFEFLHIDNPHV